MGSLEIHREPKYPGEDVSFTSNRELSGFYAYSWAAEVFVVCGMATFIPITLEQLARDQGVLLSDRSKPCHTAFAGPQQPSSLSNGAKEDRCIVSFLGADIDTASFAMYTFSLSVLLQALLIISMSGAADHGRFRKTFLVIFAFIGAIATMFMLSLSSGLYALAALFAIIANTCLGASFVLLNSFLPVLVRNHPTVVFAEDTMSGADEDLASRTELAQSSQYSREESARQGFLEDVADSASALLPRDNRDIDRTIPYEVSTTHSSTALALSTKISSYGMGIGYIASIIVLIFSIFIVQLTASTTWSLRLAVFIVGAWWFIFTIPALLWLRPRPGPPLKLDDKSNRQACFAYFSYAWRALGKTVIRARRLKDVLLFLLAWFLLSDAIATVSGTAILFGKTVLGMTPPALALVNVVSTISGVVGAFGWPRLSAMMGLRPSQTIVACIALFEIIPLYALLGFIPGIQNLGMFGLQEIWEMYPLGAVYGFVLGGLSSYCRSLFGEIVPPGFEAAFFALYAITDKGSSIFGPAIVGAITDATGGIRPAFWFLAVLVGLPMPIMMMVDVDRGRKDGVRLAKELNEQHKLKNNTTSATGAEAARVDSGTAEERAYGTIA